MSSNHGFWAKVYTFALFSLLLLVVGCGGKKFPQDNFENNYLQKEVEKLDLSIGNDWRYFMSLGKNIYYISVYDDSSKIGVCRSEIDNHKSSLLATIEDETFISYAVDNSAGEVVYLMTVDYDSLSVSKLDDSGQLNNALVHEYDAKSNGYPKLLLVDDDFFYVFFRSSFLIFKKDGTIYKTVDTDNMALVTGIICKDGELELVLSTNSGKYCFSKYNVAKSEWSKIVETEAAIYQIAKADNKLYSLGPGCIFEVDPDTFSMQKIVNLDYHGISASEVQSFSFEDDIFYMVTRDYLGSKKPMLVKISNAQDDSLKKEVIKVFCTDGSARDLGDIELIKSYNEQNNNYFVEIVENKGPFEVTFLKEEKPDVIYFCDQDTALNYIDNAFCENLIPYLTDSKELSQKNINEKAFSVFGGEDCLYAIPTAISARTLLTPARLKPTNDGWTTKEYLDWLRSNPDVCALGGMTKQTILEDCLYGSIEEYIDVENGSASFNTEEFARILTGIYELPQMHNEESVYVSVALVRNHDYKNMKYLKREIVEAVYELAQKEYCLGDELVFVGFPNSYRNHLALIDCNSVFAIFSESDNKQGAYDFIEYAMKYRYARTVEEREETSIGKMWTIQSFAEKDLQGAIGTFNLLHSGTEEITKDAEICINSSERDVSLFCSIIDNAKPLYQYEKKIIDIIFEEAEPFFAGQKTADEVCSIIQKRATIVLQENLSK